MHDICEDRKESLEDIQSVFEFIEDAINELKSIDYADEKSFNKLDIETVQDLQVAVNTFLCIMAELDVLYRYGGGDC